LEREEKGCGSKKTRRTRTRTNKKLNPHDAGSGNGTPDHTGGRRVLSPLRHPRVPGKFSVKPALFS